MARSDDGQDGGFGRRFWCVCVVPCWVGVTPTCINELMRRLMLAFKSPLVLWPLCPPLLSCFSFFHTNTLFAHTVNITHARSLIYIGGGRRAASLSRKHSWWWNEEECARMFVFLCLHEGWRVGGGGWGQNMGLVCAPAFTCMWTVRTENEMSWNFFLIFSSIFCSWLFPHFLFFFFSCFFPFFRQVPWKRKPSVFCSGSQRGLPNAQLLSSASSPVSRYANFLWWSEGHRDKSAAL